MKAIIMIFLLEINLQFMMTSHYYLIIILLLFSIDSLQSDMLFDSVLIFIRFQQIFMNIIFR